MHMTEHFADRLLEQCRIKGAPVCVGIDPVIDRLPPDVQGDDPIDAIRRWTAGVIEAVAPHVPCVKIQSACYERYHAPGVAVYDEAIALAQRAGLIVIGDAKRGDIGISARHYAHANTADALTVNSYLGGDSLEPFIETAAERGGGLFALVRTSNPGGDALQALRLEDGRTVADAVADMIAQLGEGYVGSSGYSLLGAVVGATKRDDAARLRQRMAKQLFLVPGFGAQGGTADDVKACFNDDGQGAIITASRSVIYPSEPAASWRQAVANAAKLLNQQIAEILG
jgi:orotidine-5'-phosphate decarboxylase